MTEPIKLAVFTDFVCPWCYLSTPRIEKLRRNFDIDIQWAYFPLHPRTPAEGIPLEQLFAGRGLDLTAMHIRMKGLMDAEGLPYNQRTHTYNSRLAQELAKWADSLPGYEMIHEALYQAYFVNGRNIGDVEVLVEIAQAVGLSPDLAREILTRRTFERAVDADWTTARRLGVTGVPTFVVDGHKLVGAQPYEALANWLQTEL